MLAQRFVACRKARPRAPSDAFRPILPLAEARAGNKQLKIGRQGTGRLEIGRLWCGLVRVRPVRTPRTRAGKVLELEFGLKTPQPPALPEAADARDAPAAQIAR